MIKAFTEGLWLRIFDGAWGHHDVVGADHCLGFHPGLHFDGLPWQCILSREGLGFRFRVCAEV